jgi:hypothetical protein
MANLFRPLMVVLFICLVAAAANYYMDLGWFGRYGRLALRGVMLVGLFAVIYLPRMSRNRE